MLPSSHTHAVLDKIITLTNERDLISLEYLLAKALYDLILPKNIDVANAVKIYHARNLDKQIFTTTDSERKPNGEPLSQPLKDVLQDCFIKGDEGIFNEEGKPSVTLYPLKNSQGNCIAVIAIQALIDDTELNHTVSMVLQVYQNFAGLIRDNEHDTLTGLLNRKTFEKKVSKTLNMMQRRKMRSGDKQHSAYFLAIFDIDHFKKINDEYGHLIGDDVLVHFSKLMAETFREKDMLFRYGGEEFIAVFECAQAADIQLVLERFRKRIAQTIFPKVGHVKVSIGLTQFMPDDVTLKIVDRADQALYFAKNNGRNQICNYATLVQSGAINEALATANA